MTTTSSVTLRGDWVPNNQANCLKTDDIWQWDYGIPEDRRTVLGAPSQTSECLPRGWSRSMTYAGTQCPPRYTEACQATEEGLAVVCCPTMYNFSCHPPTDVATVPHGSVFRCRSQYTDTGTWVVTQTFMTAAEPSTSLATPTYGPGYHLFALAIIYATPTSVSVSQSYTGNLCDILIPTRSLTRSRQNNRRPTQQRLGPPSHQPTPLPPRLRLRVATSHQAGPFPPARVLVLALAQRWPQYCLPSSGGCCTEGGRKTRDCERNLQTWSQCVRNLGMVIISTEAQTQARATHNHCAQNCLQMGHSVQSCPDKLR